jgi:conjugal transfer pilin signal peptidase TrbI
VNKRTSLILIGTCLGLILGFVLSQTHLTINHSPSLGYKAFLCFKGLTPKRGDFVSIEGHPTAYFEGLHYTKRLVGLPGERIQTHDNHEHDNHGHVNQMFVGDHFVGTLRTVTRDGKPLHPLKATTIPEGYVFVSADNPQSFDSRYEEFGLVKKTCIRGICRGFFKSEEGVL